MQHYPFIDYTEDFDKYSLKRFNYFDEDENTSEVHGETRE